VTRPDVSVHIDELIVHGVAPAERDRIGEAVRLELTRLIAERGLPASTHAVASPPYTRAARPHAVAARPHAVAPPQQAVAPPPHAVAAPPWGGGVVEVASGASAAEVGAQIARAVYARLGR
jgi:hypothetical protein